MRSTRARFSVCARSPAFSYRLNRASTVLWSAFNMLIASMALVCTRCSRDYTTPIFQARAGSQRGSYRTELETLNRCSPSCSSCSSSSSCSAGAATTTAAGAAASDAVKHDELVAAVAERAGVSRRYADEIVLATLTALGERLTADETRDLLAQLPKKYKQHVNAVSSPTPMT